MSALDGSDSRRISYSDTAAFDSCLVYTAWTGEAWDRQFVDGSGKGGSALALDIRGLPHVAYGAHSSLMYAWRSASAWNVEAVVSAGTPGDEISIAVDARSYQYTIAADHPLVKCRFGRRGARRRDFRRDTAV